MKKQFFRSTMAGCALAAMSSSCLALSVTIGTTTIIDGGAGDTNPAAGVIDFSLASVTGSSGTYSISGTVIENTTGTTSLTSGAALTLTNLDIEALTGNVNDTIAFDSSTFPIFSLPATGIAYLSGNWTSGSSNAAAPISGADLTLNAWNVGDWQWNSQSGTNAPFVVPFSTASADSTSASFNVIGAQASLPNTITPYYGFVADQADWTSVRGTLAFNLANAGDGFWLPSSADIETGDLVTTVVPLPGGVWLFLSGLAGFASRFVRSRHLS